jgi:cytidylate kinase
VVSAYPEVRELMVEMQRAWVADNGGAAVVEGRDIGSVVFPKADIKIYLDAAPEVRAERRARDTGQGVDAVRTEHERRDRIDSTRDASPLQVPEGATVIDTSYLEIEDVIQAIVDLTRSG